MASTAESVRAVVPDARLIPTKDIFVVSNTRKRFPDLTELKASIAQHGILQPLRVQDAGDKGFRLIFGECRWRAARELKLAAVPAIVVDATEQQILEWQLIENGQRKDIHWVEESDAYHELRTKHSLGIEEIALRVGKSRSHILLRLKLVDLVPDARKACYRDELSIRGAYALARIPSAELQQLAFDEIHKRQRGLPLPDAEIERFIRERFMLALDRAPFDRRDATLVPSAGACGPCPKRTGSNRDLFGDIKDKDVCTDPTCFEQKKQAAWTRLCETALERGWEVLDETESLKLFPHGSYVASDAKYVDLDSLNHADPKGRTWRQLLSRASVQVVLAKDTFDKSHALVRVEEATAALIERGYDFSHRKESAAVAEMRAEQRAVRERTLEKSAIAAAAISAVVDAAMKKPADETFWRLILAGLAQGSWHEVIADAVKRRGWAEKGKRPEEQLRVKLAKLSVDELRGLVLELVVGRGAHWVHSSDYGEGLKTACTAYGIRLSDVAKQVRTAKTEAKNKAA